MKKIIFLLVILSVCIVGCAGKHKKTETSEPGVNYSDSNASMPSDTQSLSEAAEQSSAFSSDGPGTTSSAVTPESMTKKDVQLALQKAGLYKGAIDGKYGPKTRVAVKEFQKANGLVADGLVGKKTKAALVRYLN